MVLLRPKFIVVGRKRKTGLRKPSGDIVRKTPHDRVERMRSLIGDCRSVYVATDGKYCKIGLASNPFRRVDELQTSSANELRMERMFWLHADHAAVLEHLLHRVLRKSRFYVRGEWYCFDVDTAAKCIEEAARRKGFRIWIEPKKEAA